MAIAAIWARISTPKQGSLEGDVAEVKPWLEAQGYIVPQDKILMIDWSSLSLMECPDMQKLWGWVTSGEISAIGMFDRDRLHSEPAHKLLFLEECERHGVKILAKYGPPLLDGDEGKLIEHALTLGKKKQVLRAQISSKVHLVERATVKGLPTTCQAPLGYGWDNSRSRLLANAHWETASLIWQLALAGTRLKGIRRELHRRGIPSPRGREWWSESTIRGVVKDTVYYGEYRALKRENCEPKQRRGNTYGKTSSKRLPGIPLPNIVVESPIVTKQQFEWVQVRLEENRRNAKRNGKRDYLLKGMIVYQGDGLRYFARTIRGNCWAYIYPWRGNRTENPRPYLPGRKLEAQVETVAREVLTSREVLERELGWRRSAISESIARIENELRSLERKATANANAESELVGLRIRDKVSDDAYERQLGLLQTERQWIQEHRNRLKAELGKLRNQSIALVGLEQLKDRVEERLASQDFADRRFVLEALGTKVIVTPEDEIEVEFAIPTEAPGDAIAVNLPLSACPRY